MIKPVYDEQSYLQTNQSNIIQAIGQPINVNNSILILISPRDMCDHFKRPYIYNFNNEVVEGIARNIVNEPSMSHSVRATINSTPYINQSIIPDTQFGFDVATSAYSHNWSFVFMIDDDTDGVIPHNTNIKNRKVYIGMCSEEPISQFGLASATPEKYLNPNCRLIITKQLLLRKTRSIGVIGNRDIVKTAISENVVHYNPTLWGDSRIPSNSETYYSLDPSNIHNRTIAGTYGNVMTVDDYSNSLNVIGSTVHRMNIESPRQHISNILSAIESGASSVRNCETIGDFSDMPISNALYRLDDDASIFESYVHSAFSETNNLNGNISNNALGDVCQSHLTISMICQSYAPRIIPVIIPQTQNVDVIPQQHRSVSNIFSAVVCNTIPAYLSNTNLSEIAFMYNSYHDAISVQHIAALVPTDNNGLHIIWNAFEHLLRTDLFPILRHNGGEFDLQVMSMINGTTNVVLNFLDNELIPIGAVYQENTNLGGIVSSLVGTSQHVQTNSIRLNDLIRSVGINAKPC